MNMSRLTEYVRLLIERGYDIVAMSDPAPWSDLEVAQYVILIRPRGCIVYKRYTIEVLVTKSRACLIGLAHENVWDEDTDVIVANDESGSWCAIHRQKRVINMILHASVLPIVN